MRSGSRTESNSGGAFVARALALVVLAAAWLLAGCTARTRTITVGSLLGEMVDLEALAREPRPFFKQASASSYSRESHKGGDAWFDNKDVGQYVRTENTAGRVEHVLADLAGPGAVTRFWSANPTLTSTVRFYFDGEVEPRLSCPLEALFTGRTAPFGPEFSYISGTGGNLYYPLPYAASLKITIEQKDKPVRLYYEIGYRTYETGTRVETFDPRLAASWRSAQAQVASALTRPETPAGEAGFSSTEVSIPPGESRKFEVAKGPATVVRFTAQVVGTNQRGGWSAPERAHNAYRSLLLEVSFDGERSIFVPLGDFFGSGPGVNPYENLFFTVEASGKMTSRLRMPFGKSMILGLTNTSTLPYTVALDLRFDIRQFSARDWHLRAQWGTITRESWPPFDTNVLTTTGEGKVVGTVYQIANPVLVWWGEGDQKISVDGEAFPSTFGTGTEDDYGYAYGDNKRFTRPYHAQTRVDGPWSGGHISLNRWYVLDALPYRSSLRFDQEMWHWMPSRPTWNHVVYWYAKPGSPGPREIDRDRLAPVDLGVPEAKLSFEGEALEHSETSGTAGKERLANCAGAEHLVWRNAKVGGRLSVHVEVPDPGRYVVELNLCQSPNYGRHRILVNGKAAAVVDGYSPTLYWQQPRLGVFEMTAGRNTLLIEALPPNPKADPGSLFGLDYVLLVRQ